MSLWVQVSICYIRIHFLSLYVLCFSLIFFFYFKRFFLFFLFDVFETLFKLPLPMFLATHPNISVLSVAFFLLLPLNIIKRISEVKLLSCFFPRSKDGNNFLLRKKGMNSKFIVSVNEIIPSFYKKCCQ